MLQSRRFGEELLVGLHSDEDILLHKGPTVMSLAERTAAVNACRFSTMCIPHAPYVTSIPWISHYGCKYVTHGDDISSDASGNDCYRFAKKAGRMKIVPRTPGISTTDLVGRMLDGTTDHFIRSLSDCIEGTEERPEWNGAERRQHGKEMQKRIIEYAAAPNGRDPFVVVYDYKPNPSYMGPGDFASLAAGIPPRPGQRLVYVDGGFDLFSSGHIAFLDTVSKLEEEEGRTRGWYSEAAEQQRIDLTGSDYAPSYIIAGVHDDRVVNQHRGANYPIMNIFERGLCVVQCTYIHGLVFGAPFTPSARFLDSLPFGRRRPDAVYHGPTAFMPPRETEGDPYQDAKSLGIFKETPTHDFQDVNAANIVQRILDRRGEYEERQVKKGAKSAIEVEQKERELEETAEVRT
jgi:ethanolamine-phosphate cytidylyltransferase